MTAGGPGVAGVDGSMVRPRVGSQRTSYAPMFTFDGARYDEAKAYDDAPAFVDALTAISDGLCDLPREARAAAHRDARARIGARGQQSGQQRTDSAAVHLARLLGPALCGR